MPPNPADPSLPHPQANQPTIRSFLRRSVRESVASAMDIDLSNQEGHESQESRKRDREDADDSNMSILGPDVQDRPLSDSLINNTSLIVETQDARRRRVSSADIQTPDRSSTPNPIILQMREIREAITNSDIEDITVHDQPPQDSSSVAVDSNIQSMVDGVVSLTERVVPDRNQMAWDNTGMPSHPPMPSSPLPTPFPPSQAGADSPPEGNISDIMSLVRAKMEECSSGLQSILTERMTEIEGRARANQIEIRDVSSKVAENTARIDQTRAEIRDIESAIIPEMNERIRQQEVRIVEASNTLDENNSAIYDALSHVNRIEARVAQISSAQTNSSSMQSILRRIEVLEAQNNDQREIITRLEDDRQKFIDNETMRTVLLRGFRVPRDRDGTRARARSVLSSIGCEDILPTAQKVRFSSNDRILRLTFPSNAATSEATVWFSQALRQIKESGNHTDINFTIETPGRFARQRRALNEIGHRMKSRREITRYDFVILKGQLWLRTYAPGQRANLIPSPPDEPMDTDQQPSPAPACPICMGEYDQQSTQAAYFCGHTFHQSCLATALSSSTNCPVCRMSPDYTEVIRADCDVCHTYISEDREHDTSPGWSLSAKCGHLHHSRCAEKYLTDRQCPYPPGPTEISIIQSNPDMKGCISCQHGDRNSPDAYSRVVYEISPCPDLPSFINLGMNGPGQLPRRWPGRVVDLSQLLGTGTRPRRPPTRNRSRSPRSTQRSPHTHQPSQLSGANSQPLGDRRRPPPQGESLLRLGQREGERARENRQDNRSRSRNDRNRSPRVR